MTDLFSKFELKGLALPNRVVMSPMTRTRATEDDVATDLIGDYHAQRASAELIITESTQVSDQAHGIIRAPGIHRRDQVAAWMRVVHRVHAAWVPFHELCLAGGRAGAGASGPGGAHP